ncbi:MAG: hypothetical protein GY838_18595 [bacterium]|nr:hypothetical protein [bacterium]
MASGPVEPEYYFYERCGYGSDHLSGPLRLILNGGYGIIKMEGRSNCAEDIDYQNGWNNVWRNLRHPVKSIEAKGWWEFIKSEVLPVSFNSGDAQYWPNYWNHLLGGGFSYRLMREWYRAHGFEHEIRWSVGTMVVYHLLNETVEMDSKTSWRVDPIADVYLFDVAGILLFSSDRVSRFFGRTLNMADWSFQPLWDPERGRFENIGLNYMMRLRLSAETPWYLFYHWGNGGELGLTRHVGGDHYLSCGAGWVAKNLEDVDGISETANLARSVGMFYDRGGSLMASVLYSKNLEARWQVNVYPGLVDLGPLRPGLAFIETQSNDIMLGVTIGNAPLLPLGLGRRFARGE